MPVDRVPPGRINNVKGTPLQLFGNVARRVGRGPHTSNLDFSIFRNFAVKARFNPSNTPAFFLPSAASPALTIGNATFGKLTASSATGRQLQLGLKFVF